MRKMVIPDLSRRTPGSPSIEAPILFARDDYRLLLAVNQDLKKPARRPLQGQDRLQQVPVASLDTSLRW